MIQSAAALVPLLAQKKAIDEGSAVIQQRPTGAVYILTAS
jgi:hypothetical protein